MTLGTLLGVAPWSLHIYKTYGDLVIADNGLGYNTWYGNHPKQLILYKGKNLSPQDMQEIAFEQIQMRETKELLRTFREEHNYDKLGPNGRARAWLTAAYKRAKANPQVQLELFKQKLLVAWSPWINPIMFARWKVVISFLFTIFLWVCTWQGFWASWTRNSGYSWFFIFLAILAISQTLALVAVLPVTRYRVSTLDPFFSILAGGGATTMLTKLANSARRIWPLE